MVDVAAKERKDPPEVFNMSTHDKEEIEKRILQRIQKDNPGLAEIDSSDPIAITVSAIAQELSDYRGYANEIALTQFRKSDQKRAPKRFGYALDYEERIRRGANQDINKNNEDPKQRIREVKIVRAIDVTTENREKAYGKLIAFVISEAKKGELDSDFRKKIEAYINQDGNKIKTDTIEVRGAKAVPYKLEAKLDLDANTPPSKLGEIKTKLLEEFPKVHKIGVPCSESWIYAMLQAFDITKGVKAVHLLSKPPVIHEGQFAYLEQVTLNPGEYYFGGY